MTYIEYYNKVCDLCIVDNGETWHSYILPYYRALLKESKLDPSDSPIEDYSITIEEVKEMLDLEVRLRYCITDKKQVIMEWLYELFNQEIEPAKEAAQTELINDLVEYLKQKNVIGDKAAELKEREDELTAKEEAVVKLSDAYDKAYAKLPRMTNFSKREKEIKN